MVSLGLLLCLASTFGWTSATPTFNRLVVHERLNRIPAGFVNKGLPSSETELTLRIALVSNNLAGLETALYDVSTPSNSRYGQHLSKEEITSFVAPSSETTAAVNQWLAANGLQASPISPAGDLLSISVDAKKANELFAAEFSVFNHQATGRDTIRTLSYSIPAALEGHIDFVHPTIGFPVYAERPPIMFNPMSRGNISTNVAHAPCASRVTPACLQAQYGIPPSVPNQTASQIAVSGFNDQFAQIADLQRFLVTYRPDLPPTTTFGLQTLDGGSNPQGVNYAGIEANLDIQYTVGVAGGVPTTFISVGSDNHDGVAGMFDLTNFLLMETSPPQVWTTSYGFNEHEIPSSIARSLCNAYMQLGARGVSVFFSSGDGGVAGVLPRSCTAFIPTFPSGCPYVTSVGATTGINPEVSASFSSGGFSNLFLQPDYQSVAVSRYLTFLGNTNAGRYTKAGRAFPDVAAQGEHVVIINGGLEGLVAGTSCSAPIFASMIALLNAELIAAGKSVLGFLNPFLYSNPTLFTDISVGDNPGCDTNGFPATSGWDPVTGLGTPKYEALKRAVGL